MTQFIRIIASSLMLEVPFYNEMGSTIYFFQRSYSTICGIGGVRQFSRHCLRHNEIVNWIIMCHSVLRAYFKHILATLSSKYNNTLEILSNVERRKAIVWDVHIFPKVGTFMMQTAKCCKSFRKDF